LLLVRYAIAAPLGGKVTRDADRRLTERGEERFRLVALALARLVPAPRAILTSPLVRARQTAEIAAQTFGGPRPKIVTALADGDWDGIRRALGAYRDEDTVVLVGHENWLSDWTARLLAGKSGRAFRYRKGGAALIESDRSLDHAALLWFIPPRVFRML